MKHTPGPWVAPKDMTNVVVTLADNNDPQVGALLHGMQISVSLNRGEAQARADALLVAQAPTLLKAVKLALMEFDRISYQKKADPEIIEILEKVVRLAQGESK